MKAFLGIVCNIGCIILVSRIFLDYMTAYLVIVNETVPESHQGDNCKVDFANHAALDLLILWLSMLRDHRSSDIFFACSNVNNCCPNSIAAHSPSRPIVN